MYKYLFFLFCCSAMACSQNSSSNETATHWQYQPQHHSETLDAHCQPMVAKFQDLLKGVMNKDTAYMNTVAIEMIQQLDSIATLDFSKDTILNQDIKAGFNNIAGELAGIVIGISMGDEPEIKMAVNMTAIQILNLLGKAGYQKQNIYIFHTADAALEDGLYWFGIQKTAKNPYQPEQKKEVEATYMLQEK
jgi:hypothetical protein